MRERTYFQKAFTNALVLTLRNLAVSMCQSKTKQRECPPGVLYYSHWYIRLLRGIKGTGVLYTLSAWAFGVARFDWMGNARALMRGTSDKYVPYAFFFC